MSFSLFIIICSCAGWRFNCSGAVITANTVVFLSTKILNNAHYHMLKTIADLCTDVGEVVCDQRLHCV